MSDVVRACDVVDELVADDGSVVLVAIPGGHRVVRLSRLGALIRELSVSGVPMEVLVRELEARLGALDGEQQTWQLTTEAVAALAADGLLDVERGPRADG